MKKKYKNPFYYLDAIFCVLLPTVGVVAALPYSLIPIFLFFYALLVYEFFYAWHGFRLFHDSVEVEE